MDTDIAQQFVDFFNDFLDLCRMEKWPENETTETEIKNAFLTAIHIEKAIKKLRNKDILNEFMTTLSSSCVDSSSKLFLNKCFADPPKLILRKIIMSDAKISQMDVGFKIFVHLFSEEKLENCLAELMLEAASQDTLFRHLPVDICKEDQISFKSQMLLLQLNLDGDCNLSVVDFVQNCDQHTLELLVVSLLNTQAKFSNAVASLKNAFTEVMMSKNLKDKNYWKNLSKVSEQYFVALCLKYGDLFRLIVSALVDCGKLHKEQMSADYFYIDLNYSQLVNIVQTICSDENLKIEFFDIVREISTDLEFWTNMLIM